MYTRMEIYDVESRRLSCRGRSVFSSVYRGIFRERKENIYISDGFFSKIVTSLSYPGSG